MSEKVGERAGSSRCLAVRGGEHNKTYSRTPFRQMPVKNGVSIIRVVLSVIAYYIHSAIEGVIITIPRLFKIASA